MNKTNRYLPFGGLVAASFLLASQVLAQDGSPQAQTQQPADNRSCAPKERFAETGTPVFGGPGLGFEIVSVIPEGKCFKNAQTSSDGSFALVILEEEKKVGWVATGLVDARLSAPVELMTSVEKPATEETVKAVRPLALRSQPRFDALAVAMPLKEGRELKVRGTSKDGQWQLLEVTGSPLPRLTGVEMPISSTDSEEVAKSTDSEDAAQNEATQIVGWAPKYKVAAKLPEAGEKPSAGSGGWAETRSSRKSMEALAADRRTTDASRQKGTPSSKSGDVASEDGKAETDNNQAAEDGQSQASRAVTAAPAAPVLGRTQEAGLFVGYRFWQQNYQSDAFLDGFYQYDWIAPAGVSLGGHYGYRGEFPLVFEVRGQVGLSGWQHPGVAEQPSVEAHPVAIYTADATDSFIVVSPQLHLSTRMAWRLFATSTVDVDAGMIAALDGFLNFGLGDQPVPTLLHGFYASSGPSLVARSRLGENGRFGLLVVEAQLPIGAYTMQEDPVGRYNALPETDRVVPPPATAGADIQDENQRVQGLPLHLGVGIDGRVRYQYAITHLFRVEAGLGVLLRQATIGGPGYRSGLYSKANNVDALVTVHVGTTFGF